MSSIFFLMLKCKSNLELPVPCIVATCHRTKKIKGTRKPFIFAFDKKSEIKISRLRSNFIINFENNDFIIIDSS